MQLLFVKMEEKIHQGINKTKSFLTADNKLDTVITNTLSFFLLSTL